MRRLGRVIHLSKNRNLILKGKVKIGAHPTVLDDELNPIGKVHDVFGPVEDPYISVRPLVKNPQEYVGCILYVSDK